MNQEYEALQDEQIVSALNLCVAVTIVLGDLRLGRLSLHMLECHFGMIRAIL
jgi:hypothetical protein